MSAYNMTDGGRWRPIAFQALNTMNGSSNSADEEVLDEATVMHILPLVYGVLCLTGVGANSLVICTVLSCRTKGISDIYILSLATADLLFLVGMPFTIHQLVRHRHWVFGQVMCKIVTVMDVSNQFTTVGTVTTLCIDSLLLTVPVMLYSKTIQVEDFEVCVVDLPSGPKDMYWYTLYQSILGFMIPLIIISTFYSLTLFHVFKSLRRVGRRQSVPARRATKTVLMVITVFLVCWSPFHVMQVLNLTTTVPTPLFLYSYHVSICLSYAHSCINPLMLLFFTKTFQERFSGKCGSVVKGDASSRLRQITTRMGGVSDNQEVDCKSSVV
uniref:Melanin concentrating hormone receptor 2b n=1 Tax=Callorhinchus milii TaxID=7868 RepID=A0A4W3K6H2_CALMI